MYSVKSAQPPLPSVAPIPSDSSLHCVKLSERLCTDVTGATEEYIEFGWNDQPHGTEREPAGKVLI